MRAPLPPSRAGASLALALAALAGAPLVALAAAAIAPPGYGLLEPARHGAFLGPGASGIVVEALQRALVASGVALVETGIFDPATEAAVRGFQSAHGAAADGVVGPLTLGALDRALGLPANGVPLVGTNVPPPPGYHAVRGPVPADATAKAVEILHGPDPIGTQKEIGLAGKDYVFAVEWHKHAPTDRVPDRLKHWHRGVTVYERVP
jgi:peptidoglycan hydrolase-like protein with peptidoglycan-binding domain